MRKEGQVDDDVPALRTGLDTVKDEEMDVDQPRRDTRDTRKQRLSKSGIAQQVIIYAGGRWWCVTRRRGAT